MLTITVLGQESFNEETGKFVTVGDTVVRLEHSLVSLSKWESIWEKPFLDKQDRTPEESLSYIQCMILDEETPADVFEKLSQANIDDITEYLNRKMTATWFNDSGQKSGGEVITSELIYYWLVAFQIDFEVQYWHLNRLFTLIKVCNTKQEKKKPMSRQAAAARQREINEKRKAQLGTKG